MTIVCHTHQNSIFVFSLKSIIKDGFLTLAVFNKAIKSRDEFYQIVVLIANIVHARKRDLMG
jgi:hypothetical protein